MLAKPTKLILVVCLFLGILGCVTTSSPKSTLARNLKVTIDMDQREQYFVQLQKFADKHSLEFSISLYDTDGEIFLVRIQGDGFHVTSGGHEISPKEVDINFFNEASPPTSQQVIDGLLNDLKSFINEIPNVIITEQP